MMNHAVPVLEPVRQKVEEAPKAYLIDDALANLSASAQQPVNKSDIDFLNGVRQGALIGAMLASFSAPLPPTIGSIMPELPPYHSEAREFAHILAECKKRLEIVFPSTEIQLRQQVDSEDGSVQPILGIITEGTDEAYAKLNAFKEEWWNEKRTKLRVKTLVVKIDGKRQSSV